jgi:hypothetical protein
MRPQSKPFTVERKRSRKPLTRTQPLLAMEDGSKLADDRRLPVNFAEVDRVFGKIRADRSNVAAASASTTRTRDDPGLTHPAEPAMSAHRILPDLSPHEWLADRRDDQDALPAPAFRRSRWPKKTHTKPKVRRLVQTEGMTVANKSDPSAAQITGDNRIDVQPLSALPAAPNGKAAAKPGRKRRSTPTAEGPDMSAREIRRATARGVFKIAAAWSRRHRLHAD